MLAMGELGFPTRVLSPVFGGVYTYAAPMHAQGTAAGQVSARLAAAPLSHREVHQSGQDLRRDRRPRAPFAFRRPFTTARFNRGGSTRSICRSW